MNKFCLTGLLVFLWIVSSPILLHSQSMVSLEQNLESNLLLLTSETKTYDSLNTLYQKLITDIDNEKRKPNPDHNTIVNKMSSSVLLSNSLELFQTKMNTRKQIIGGLKKSLNFVYSKIIDSLMREKKKNQSNTGNEQIDDYLLLYMTKRLTVSPQIESFTFDAQKILSIDLTSISNPVQRELYLDYLRTAYQQVNEMLLNVTENSNQINQIQKLQKKASGFLEEREFAETITPRHSGNQSFRTTGSGTRAGADFENNLSNTIDVYSTILTQLNFQSGSDLKINEKTINSGKPITIKQYQILLKELKNKLTDYKTLLKSKIDSKK